MSTRFSGQRFTGAFQAQALTAHLVEDSVRRLAGLPAVDLAVAVVVHNGASGEEFRAHLHLLSPVEILRAPEPTEESAIWFPGLASVFPNYFLREPIWLDAEFFRNAPGGGADRAVAAIRRSARWLPSHRNSDGEFDLVQITICEPNTEVAARDLWLRVKPAGQGRSVNLLLFGPEEIRLRTAPVLPLADHGLGELYRYAEIDGLRRAYWNTLWRNLIRIQE
jgi:hypothetical protein